MEIKLCDRSQCTGCTACKQKCRHSAIHTETIGEFDYPVIDKDKCKECGLCMNACPVLNISQRKGNCHENENTVIAAWNKDTDVRMKSSSGGAFSVMAEKILAEGGVIYGAAWDDKMTLIHKGVENREDLDALRRSKYVQSDVRNTFNEVAQNLKDGRKVLYCGTPCQIAGLTAFLGKKDYDNLITVDVLCQGVPSPYLFKKYIKEIESETGWQVIDANFRTKEHGWRCGLLLLLLLRNPVNSKTRYMKRVLNKNEFYNAFIKEYFMRPSCYDCQFKNNHQGYYGDITIADFWRIGNKIPLNVKDYEKGISAVVINTDKGRSFFSESSVDCETIERTWDEFAVNGGMRSSTKPSNTDEMYSFIRTHSWRETQKLYFPLSIKAIITNSLSLALGQKRIRKIKKIIKLFI